VRIPKYCVRISPRILTTDPRPRPRPQADALSDPLSICECATRFLTHFYIQLIGLTVVRDSVRPGRRISVVTEVQLTADCSW